MSDAILRLIEAYRQELPADLAVAEAVERRLAELLFDPDASDEETIP